MIKVANFQDGSDGHSREIVSSMLRCNVPESLTCSLGAFNKTLCTRSGSAVTQSNGEMRSSPPNPVRNLATHSEDLRPGACPGVWCPSSSPTECGWSLGEFLPI